MMNVYCVWVTTTFGIGAEDGRVGQAVLPVGYSSFTHSFHRLGGPIPNTALKTVVDAATIEWQI